MGFGNTTTTAPPGSGAVGAEVVGDINTDFSNNFWRDQRGRVGYVGSMLQIGADAVGGLMAQKAANAAGNAMYANEGTLRRQAAATVATGLENQRRAVINAGKMTGSAVMARGASGITAEGSGSAGEQTILERMRGEVNDIGYQAQSESKRLNYQADLANYQARATKKAGRFDLVGTTLGVAGGIVGGAFGGPVGANVGYRGGKLAGTGITTLGQ